MSFLLFSRIQAGNWSLSGSRYICKAILEQKRFFNEYHAISLRFIINIILKLSVENVLLSQGDFCTNLMPFQLSSHLDDFGIPFSA